KDWKSHARHGFRVPSKRPSTPDLSTTRPVFLLPAVPRTVPPSGAALPVVSTTPSGIRYCVAACLRSRHVFHAHHTKPSSPLLQLARGCGKLESDLVSRSEEHTSELQSR